MCVVFFFFSLRHNDWYEVHCLREPFVECVQSLSKVQSILPVIVGAKSYEWVLFKAL